MWVTAHLKMLFRKTKFTITELNRPICGDKQPLSVSDDNYGSTFGHATKIIDYQSLRFIA